VGPATDGFEGVLRRREGEVQESVRLARITSLLCLHAGLPQASGIGPAFISERVATAQDDQRRG
jgi:hypothetical protein